MSLILGTAGNDDLDLAEVGAAYIDVRGSEGSDIYRLGGLDESSAVSFRYSNDDRFLNGTAMFFDLAADTASVRKFGVGVDQLIGIRNLFQQSAGGWIDVTGSDGDDMFTFNSHAENGDLHWGAVWMGATLGQDVVNLTDFAGRFQQNYNTPAFERVMIDLRNGIVEKVASPFDAGVPQTGQRDVLMLPRGPEAEQLTVAFRTTQGDDTVFGADDGFRLELRLGGGRDVFVGGVGHDTLQYHSSGLAAPVTGLGVDMAMGLAIGSWGGFAFRHIFSGVDAILGGQSNDVIAGSRRDEELTGGAGNDWLSGRGGEDMLWGNEDRDKLNGGSGRDHLDGGSGQDTLLGGTGDDTLIGGTGQDRLIGGPGADVFVFRSAAEAGIGAQRDVIRDFQPGQDRIDLSEIMPGMVFVGNSAFGGRPGEIRQIAANGRLAGDLDGDGRADFEIALANGVLIDAGDLIL